MPQQESKGPLKKMSHIWEGTWQSKCFLRFDSRNLVKVKPWKNIQVCWSASWKGGLCHPEGWGRQRKSPEHDSLGTILISSGGLSLKPEQQAGLYPYLWSSVMHALQEQYMPGLLQCILRWRMIELHWFTERKDQARQLLESVIQTPVSKKWLAKKSKETAKLLGESSYTEYYFFHSLLVKILWLDSANRTFLAAICRSVLVFLSCLPTSIALCSSLAL